MAAKQLPPTEYLRKLLSYEEATGILLWRERSADMFGDGVYPAVRRANTWNSKMAGKPALASRMSNGYLHGAIEDDHYLAHRVIWKLVTGAEPDQIDHISGKRDDNRFANLRNATTFENMRNRGVGTNNRSGHLGVWQVASSGKWAAQIECVGIVTNLGNFATKDEAVFARRAAERERGFNANHGARPCHAIASAILAS